SSSSPLRSCTYPPTSYIYTLSLHDALPISCGERPVDFPVVEQTAPVAVMTPSLRDKIFSTSRGTDKLFCKFSCFKISLIRGECSAVFIFIPPFLKIGRAHV